MKKEIQKTINECILKYSNPTDGRIADYLFENDVIKIIRCKNCIFKQEKEEYGDLKCAILGTPMKFDDFCSYGESKLWTTQAK